MKKEFNNGRCNDYDLLISQAGRFDYNQVYAEKFEDFNHLNSLRIACQPGNICTYNCTYCDWTNKSGNWPWPDHNQFAKLIKRIDDVYRAPPYNKKHIIWELLGGEITVWPHIDKMINLLNERGHHIQLITNGVRNLRWWNQNADRFSHVTLSYHPESADYRHMNDVGNLLSDRAISTGMLVLMYPPLWDRCVEAFKHFRDHGRYPTECKTLYDTHDSHGEFYSWDYTSEQRQFVIDNQKVGPEVESEQENPSLFTVYKLVKDHDDQVTINQTNVNDLLVRKENNWKDWDCYIGMDTLYMSAEGNIKRGAQCFPDKGYIGNWRFDDPNDIKWPTKPIRCEYTECLCAHDVRARKIRRDR